MFILCENCGRNPTTDFGDLKNKLSSVKQVKTFVGEAQFCCCCFVTGEESDFGPWFQGLSLKPTCHVCLQANNTREKSHVGCCTYSIEIALLILIKQSNMFKSKTVTSRFVHVEPFFLNFPTIASLCMTNFTKDQSKTDKPNFS